MPKSEKKGKTESNIELISGGAIKIGNLRIIKREEKFDEDFYAQLCDLYGDEVMVKIAVVDDIDQVYEEFCKKFEKQKILENLHSEFLFLMHLMLSEILQELNL